ncbi:MAG: hypothetical protein ACE5MM_06765 [Nitrospiraceae bacterium]
MDSAHIAYYCPRVNLLKLYGPIIAEQKRRGSGLGALVVVPLAPLITYAGKNRNLAAALRLQQVQAELGPDVEIACVASPGDFLDLLRKWGVLAAVSVGLRLPSQIRDGVVASSRARSVRWCSLGYLQEELLHVMADGVGVLDDWDVVTTFSQAGVDRLMGILAEKGVLGVDRVRAFHPIGFVELDQAAGFDRRILREKYGLPQDRPVICFATAPRFAATTLSNEPDTFKSSRAMRWLFRRDWYRGALTARVAGGLWGRRWPGMDYLAGYVDILGCLRRFADRHGAIIIGKTRDKHDDPSYVGRLLDQLLSDGAYYPFRTLELLYLADLYVGISSSTAFEAAFVGRRMRTIVPYPAEVHENSLFFELKRDFYYESPGLWNAPTFSDLNRTYMLGEWNAFRDWAESGALETHVDSAARNAVVKRAVGFDDYKASARFLDLVEGAIGRVGGPS